MTVPWEHLADEYDHNLVAAIRRLIDEGRIAELDPSRIAGTTGVDADAVRTVLVRLSKHGIVKRVRNYLCRCGQNLSEADRKKPDCLGCANPFAEMEDEPEEHERFLIAGEPRRIVSWLIAVHGMNTTGTWQEEFSWRIATMYKYSAPVAIYKYGIVRPGALLKFRQRGLTRQLGERVNELVKRAEERGFSPRPDVICHSFGTWLIGHLLTSKDERHKALCFGRIILTGCILRPDFDWQALIDERRVEAVVNHYGTEDMPVRLAHYFIPDSGPAGRIGFIRPAAYNVPAEGWGHSSFFDKVNLRQLLHRGGLWEEFLTMPDSKLASMPNDVVKKEWIPSSGMVRVIPRYLALALAAGLIGVVAWLTVLGAASLF